jgi:hypothetical protein
VPNPDMKPHPLVVEGVRADPLSAGRDDPTLAVQYGFLGDVWQDAAGVLYRYLYLDEALQSWLLIPEDDIVLHRRFKEDATPYGERDAVWYRSDSKVRHFRRPLHQPIEESEFRSGGPPPAQAEPAAPSQPTIVREPPPPAAKPEPEEPVTLAVFKAVAVDRDDPAAKGQERVEVLAEDEQFREDLRAEFEQQVRARLGPRQMVQRVDMRPGTLELILFVGTVLSAMSGYEQSRRALDQLKRDLEWIVNGLLVRSDHTTAKVRDVSWTPGYALLAQDPQRVSEAPERRRLSGIQEVPVVYVVLVLLVLMFAVIAVLLVDALPS